MTHAIKTNPALDLVLERIVDVPPEKVWACWTQPEHVVKWFTPKPWTTTKCEIDLRPGGAFRTVMRSPEGEEFDNVGCYLEIVPNKKLVWTDALEPGYRPATKALASGAGINLTAFILIEPHGKGTKYTAIALHRSEGDRKQHEDMGFHQGWGTALDQLVDVARTL